MSLLERLGFRRRAPLRLKCAIGNPVPGDLSAGRSIMAGTIALRGEQFVLRSGDWALDSASDAFRSHIYGFTWLRDLAAAASPDQGAAFLAPILDGWLTRFEDRDEEAWRADRAGLRAAHWLLHAPLILRGDAARRKRLLVHIVQSAEAALVDSAKAGRGLPRLQAAGGALMTAHLVEGGGLSLRRAEKLFETAAAETVLPHGLPASRTPTTLLQVLDWVQVVRQAPEAQDIAVPDALDDLDGRARAGLRAARLGDGALTALHGGNPLGTKRIDHALARPGQALRGIGAGAASGLQRLEAGQTILLLDAGPPPEPEDNAAAHAGALAFELSDGAERLIVNVGGDVGLRTALDPRLAVMLRYTAAHSTLILSDTNQSVVEPGQPLGAGVDTVSVERADETAGEGDGNGSGALALTATHDGYRRNFGFDHRRALTLSETGRELSGEDSLVRAGRKRRRIDTEVALRFHLAPGIDVTETADQRGALLRTRGGSLWQVKTESGLLTVDDSLWIGEEGRAVRTRQLVIADIVPPEGWSVRWSFRKMGQS
ncbi:MAG: heparinase II/III family protein [Pacificimonas sp.]|nr:heparinase II/III family protein [Pacificimonas sp.]